MSKRRTPWPEDPVVAEVRDIRRKIWSEAGETFDGLLRLLDERVPRARVRKPANAAPGKRKGRSRK